jgi:glycerate 2-kinase
LESADALFTQLYRHEAPDRTARRGHRRPGRTVTRGSASAGGSAGHRDHLEQIRRSALAAVDPAAAVRKFLRVGRSGLKIVGTTQNVPTSRPVRLLAAGKAAVPMAEAAAGLLGERLGRGVVVTRRGQGGTWSLPEGVRLLEAGHPVPDAAGEAAARAVEDIVSGASAEDVFLTLLSGGASALLPDPAEGLTLEDLQETTSLLLRSGAPIGDLNAVRKHLARLKGGRLARLAAPARMVVLLLSDVVGDPLDVIASGPTAPDPTTYADAWRALERRGLVSDLRTAVRRHLETGLSGGIAESPKPGDLVFERVLNVVVGSCRLAAEAAVREARTLGYRTLLLSTFVEGEAREIVRVAVAQGRGVLVEGHPLVPPACLIWGGETTVTVKGSGTGGRNQEQALAAALALDRIEGVTLMALATDGSDGPTDAAGGIVDGTTAAAIRAAGVDPVRALADNDSYRALAAGGALLRTGPTGTNVNDLLVVLAGSPTGKTSVPDPSDRL